MKPTLRNAAAILALAATGSAMPASQSFRRSDSSGCDRDCLTDIVTQVLDSMVAKDPYSLPLATIYKATENTHPAALGMMTSWRTITKVGAPSLLAIDTTQQSAYFALDISEGSDEEQSVLRGRIQVVDEEITELELFINRSRGDHGFSFSATELVDNYDVLMNPPSNRTKASRATLEALSEALFAESSDFVVNIGDDCQFTELGWKVVDTGVYGNGSSDPLGCIWPDSHPTDSTARVSLVVDEELGFVVTSGMILGTVYPYQNISAFIPNKMTSAQEAQEAWIDEMKAQGDVVMMAPFGGTGDTLEVLQYYDDLLQAMQINVYVNGPNQTSPWL